MVSTNLGDQGGRVFFFFACRKVWLVALRSRGDLPQVAQNSSVGINVFMSTRLLQEDKKKNTG